MLATLVHVPSNALYLARRTTSLSLMMMGELTAAVFPSLLMPRDRIAWEAWATGYLAADQNQPLPSVATTSLRTS